MAKTLKKSSVSKKNIVMLLNAFHLGLPWALLLLVIGLTMACIS